MRAPYVFTFFLTLVLAGAYVYTAVEAVCAVPLSYRIGHIDDRFGITEDEARVAVSDAESVWEQATGRNLFTYDEQGELVINFIYDERQEFAEAEVNFREQLDAAENINSAINATYEELVADYDTLKVEYDRTVTSYESSLDSYNNKVESYNAEGGAPPEVFDELENEREELDRSLGSVNALGRRLNELGREINRVSEQGNQLIEQYNENVHQYNDTFAEESREFTQGDYQSKSIQIYKFVNEQELTLVLAHEMGHAISLGHVSNEASVMFDHLGGQSEPLQLTEEDLDEFERVCGQTTRSWIERLMIRFNI